MSTKRKSVLVSLHFLEFIEGVRKIAISYRGRLGAVLGRKRELSLRNKHTIYKMCIRPGITCASPVFARAAPKALNSLQVTRDKSCRVVTDAPWCVRNLISSQGSRAPCRGQT
ncbi:RNA-directed DNA polymerase from mobile element jockey [Eumeta japonica]|uniref:RNA-directed DNA polymerase from mobile element jockey n=1 Tax=Eumeta variegata TaxID=151549 RepID=A0A4C1VIT8_EUMVA|nr:RNA-directed DNA polymerase from mobile element jockey [Eumeta japonica]